MQGRSAQRSFVQRHFLSEQTLEMISDMRNQFGSMLADTRLLARPEKGFAQASPWIDDMSKAWNTYAKHVAVVSMLARGSPCCKGPIESFYFA